MDIQQYKPVIDDILRKLKVSKDNKEDMSQECYLELLQNEEQLGEARDPLNYAATLCRNHILELWRNQNRHCLPAESLDDPKIHRKASKISSELPKLDEELMREAMKTLPDEEVEVVDRLYVEGYSRSEVSAVLGIHTSTVDRRAKSGVEKLKQYFGEK